MIDMRKGLLLLLVAVLAAPVAIGADKADKKAAKRAEQRQKIDKVAKETLTELFKESKGSKGLYDKAYGYAVFSNYKFQFIFAGGGGHGVAVEKASGKRTYMKMGTGGIGLGIGGKKYSLVFLFENKDSYTSFVETGWQADTQIGAAAGSAAADLESTFKNGVAYYQLTKKGLIASADVSGTKFWKSDDLNE